MQVTPENTLQVFQNLYGAVPLRYQEKLKINFKPGDLVRTELYRQGVYGGGMRTPTTPCVKTERLRRRTYPRYVLRSGAAKSKDTSRQEVCGGRNFGLARCQGRKKSVGTLEKLAREIQQLAQG